MNELWGMLINQKLGTLTNVDTVNKTIDWLPLEWYETGKRILHKKTVDGKELVLKFLKEPPVFRQDDVLYEDDATVIAVAVQPCEVITIRPATMYAMASLCYEIGNKHLPLFYEDESILVPFDAPLVKWLTAQGFTPVKETRKLLNPLRTSVSAHAHTDSGTSLFSKILKLTSPNNE